MGECLVWRKWFVANDFQLVLFSVNHVVPLGELHVLFMSFSFVIFLGFCFWRLSEIIFQRTDRGFSTLSCLLEQHELPWNPADGMLNYFLQYPEIQRIQRISDM